MTQEINIVCPIHKVPTYEQTAFFMNRSFKKDPNYSPQFGRVMPTTQNKKEKIITRTVECPNCSSVMQTTPIGNERWQINCQSCGVAGPYKRDSNSALTAFLRIIERYE